MKKKHKLIVLSNWTYPLEKSWSGTTYSLTKALGEYYDVEIKSLSIGKSLKLLNRLSHSPLLGQLFGALYDMILQAKANRIVGKNKNIPVFEICEDVKIKNPYFTYQDMTYHAGLIVKEWKKEYPFLYQAAGNDTLSIAEIHRRERKQYDEYQHASSVFFMSSWVKDIMSEFHPDMSSKMFHIGGGTNIDVNKIDITKKNGNKFLFIGRDYERKAGDLVLEAFKILKKNYLQNAELHVAGCQPKEASEGVFYYGDVSYDAVSDLFNKCDVFCMPSRFEAYGLVFIEALIYGLPCIGRRFFEMPHFIEEGKDGMLIERDVASDLAKKMYAVISDQKMIKYVQSRQSFYIERYNWDSVARRAKSVIDKQMNY